MKRSHCLIIYTFLFSSFCFSQDSTDSVFHINKIPSEGILLNKGWKFHAGDDSAWSKPEFIDKDWEPIDPSQDIRHIPQFQKASIGWLRLKLLVDSSLLNQTLGIILSQVGSSEIYMNGVLIYKLGLVSPKGGNSETHFLFNRPYPFLLGKEINQQIAVRYSYDKKGFLLKGDNPNPCFKILLNTLRTTFSKSEETARLRLLTELISTSFI
jgi:hypothetical protein